jgi:hypothetical protein
MGQFYNYLIFFSFFSSASWSQIRADVRKKRRRRYQKIVRDIFAIFFIGQLAWKHSVFCYFKKCHQCQIIFTPKNNVELELTEEEEKEEEEEGKEEGDDGKESLDVSCNLSPVEGTKKHFC